MTKPKVAILHQGCVPTYRRPFYEKLAQSQHVDYIVFYGDPQPKSGITAAMPPFAFRSEKIINTYIEILGRTLVYQPVFRKIVSGKFDGIIIGHELKYISNILLLFFMRRKGRPVFLWGFGTDQDLIWGRRSAAGRLVSNLIAVLKRFLIRLSTGYLVYTDAGATSVIAAGLPAHRVSVVYNTIDASAEIACRQQMETVPQEQTRRELGLDPKSIVFTFIGRIVAEKRVDWLVDAAKVVAEGSPAAIEILVVGNGRDEAAVREKARGLEWCHFFGTVHHPEMIAKIFRVTDAVVIPGYVGLAVNHAFAHGVPVVTCRDQVHSPEIEYVKDGYNGLIVDGTLGLQRGLKHLATSAEARAKLAAGALESGEKLKIETMVCNFDRAVAAAFGCP